MQANVKSDVTVREINIEIIGGPDLDITERWHRYDRIIRVHAVRVRIVDGVTRGITVFGLVLKKDGTPGLNQDNRLWSVNGLRPVSEAPAWVRELFHGAPASRIRRNWTPEEVS
jgi:hypothetical protein